MNLVLGCVGVNDSSTTSRSFVTLSDNAMNSAFCFVFLLILRAKLRSLVGPNTTPPPTHCGDRMDPWRARPVPFCFQGFLPPPRTSPRVLVLATGRRRLA